MTDEEITIAMAKLDGRWVKVKEYQTVYGGPPIFTQERDPYLHELPDYLFNLNAVQKVVDTLERDEILEYSTHLCRICYKADMGMHKATARQKCEAIIQTYNQSI